ncbi:hypothetical protein ACFVWG_22615 [Kribbella sp. NPDC058245]|uniref:hypothetical protein n=1 Tax=Kribbella sp. NPDC058245 TaxID=3346399 RepID=UPI0036E8B36E
MDENGSGEAPPTGIVPVCSQGGVVSHDDHLDLEAFGARRSPNPADRRSSLLDLTADGLRLVDAAEATFTERTAELIADVLTAGQISAAAKVLALLRAQLEQDQIGMPTG